MTADEPAPPPHPHIYHVVLGARAAQQFESRADLRESAIREWSYRARGLGKRSLDVMGPYCRLLAMELTS